MKILDNIVRSLSDPRFEHVATVREGLKDFICFRESRAFFLQRSLFKPFPPKPQIYVEAIVPINVYYSQLKVIDDDDMWKTIVGLLLKEGIIFETDLLEGYHDCIAAINSYLIKKLKETKC
jgi:hypothetical protein